jgi:hypothetical protein
LPYAACLTQRHLACSQVYAKCTYEPKGTWFRGTLFIVRLLVRTAFLAAQR